MSLKPSYDVGGGDEELAGNKSTNSIVNPLENIEEIVNTSYRLQTDVSTVSNDSELSSLSLCLDREMESYSNVHVDELPAFEIRLISPLGRTPSPIDSEDMSTPTRQPLHENVASIPRHNNPDYVTLQDINAQISPPSDNGDHNDNEANLSRTSSLETIFEGVFLNTPPRQCVNFHNQRHSRSKTTLLEKVALNRLHAGKENKSPLCKEETSVQRRNSLDLSAFNQTEHSS